MRKLCAVLLALCLIWSTGSPAFASGTVIRLDGPERLPAAGESFEMTASLSGNPGLGALQFTLGFDRTVLECTKMMVGEKLAGALAAVNAHAEDGARLAVAAAEALRGDGLLVTYSFRVLKSGDPAFSLEKLTADGADGKAVPCGVEFSGYTPQAAPDFTDVPAEHWSRAFVRRGAAEGLILGYPDGSFKPDLAVTRAQFVTMLWRMAGKPAAAGEAPFEDVRDILSDYRAAIAWAAEKGYVKGTSQTCFSPDRTITREQVMTILFRYNGNRSGPELMFSPMYDSHYTDSAAISSYAKVGVYWAIYNGIVTGTSATTITPAGEATRAQIVTILVRYMDK